MEPIFDKIGQEIKPGCYIAYGHALGRCAGLRIGMVLAAERNVDEKLSGKRETYRITIWGVDGEWTRREPVLLSKKSTLQFPERIIVLPSLPEKFTKLLDT